MVTIKNLTDCTMTEIIKAWNDGFEGYSLNIKMTIPQFLERLVKEDLSPELSIVAFLEGQPIGIVVHGAREIKGKKVAWNGGTGVAPSYRRKGIGKLLMEESLKHLKENGIEIATLEVLSDNEKAASLYKKTGYEVVDTVEFLNLKNPMALKTLEQTNSQCTIKQVAPQKIKQLGFYKAMYPWQTQIDSAEFASGIIAQDAVGKELGYAYYQKRFDDEGNLLSVLLYQCETAPQLNHPEEVIKCMLGEVLKDFHEKINCTIPNLPVNQSETTYLVLKELGFQTVAKQYYMLKEL